MDRVRDYINFTVWFAGLGYIVLWPLTAPDLGRTVFGATADCGVGPQAMLDLLCDSAHPLALPPGLHVIGMLAAVFVTMRLLLMALRRGVRRRAAATPADTPPASIRPLQRRQILPPSNVKPRSQFGLRGAPR